MDRRRFLGTAGAVAAGTVAFSTLLPDSLRRALAMPVAASGSLDVVNHVVVFMQENRSFDHYFAMLRGTRGFADRSAMLLQGSLRPAFQQPNGSGTLLPFRVHEQHMNGTPHDWGSGHSALNGGRNDRWVAAKGRTTMACYGREDLAFYYALADAFTICDAYHCSVLGPTNPNRLYLWTGTIDPRGTGGGPVTTNDEPGFRWKTYPERLQAAGVTWRVYQQKDNYDDNSLAWFNQYRSAPAGSCRRPVRRTSSSAAPRSAWASGYR